MRPSLALIVLSTLLVVPSAARAQCRFPVATTGHALTYRFRPELTPDGLVLHVTVEFQAGVTGTDELAVPAQWAGETLHALTNLRALTADASIEDGPNTDAKILQTLANRPVQISYDLKNDWVGPLIHPRQFHPVLMPEYFEFTGSNALVRPRRDDSATDRLLSSRQGDSGVAVSPRSKRIVWGEFREVTDHVGMPGRCAFSVTGTRPFLGSDRFRLPLNCTWPHAHRPAAAGRRAGSWASSYLRRFIVR
jgi:hypothetical protein